MHDLSGPELNGMGPIPGLAGRSPSYLVRQLYDFQRGTRAGPWSPLMAPIIKLTFDEVVARAAYAASLPHRTPTPKFAAAK